MARLCSNRPEGFGPYSKLHPHLPTTCFLDVVVELLPTWILTLLMLVLLVPNASRLRANSSKGISKNESTSQRHATTKLHRILGIVYYLMIVAFIGMLSLEIARLAIADLGIGLLPFKYVGILIVLLNHIFWRSKTARFANVSYWLMELIVTALKTAAEQSEQQGSARRVKDQLPGGKYPTSDEALDNAVILGVQVVLIGLEFSG